jgi:hypothetical protein
VRLALALSFLVLSGALSGCLERTSEGHAWLDDVTDGSGLSLERVPEEDDATLADRMMAGVCVIDLDGAPPLDLFFTGRGSGTGLFRAVAPFHYEDASSLLDLSGLDAFGCLAVDLDGDDRDDLVVSGAGGVVAFFHREGGFVRRTLLEAPPGWLYTGIAAGDVDADGDLDLAIAGFVDVETGPVGPCGVPPCGVLLDAFAGIPNALLIQDELGDFDDEAASLAPDLVQIEATLAMVIFDLDGDGTPEIFVGNDLGDRHPDRLLVREDGRFVDRAMRWGLSSNSSGFGVDTMGIAIGDVDQSGTLDVASSDFQGWPSSVHLCGADGFCEDRGRALGLLRSSETFRWGNALIDLDLDGDLELFEAAGHLYTEEEGATVGNPLRRRQPPNLYENLGGPTGFARVVAQEGSALARPYQARGLAVLDADDDGHLDVVMATSSGRPALLRNVRHAGGHFLRVVLTGHPPNTGAVGAHVILRVEGLPMQQRLRLAGEGYLGSFDPRLHFGVPAAGPGVLEIRWPSGVTETVPVEELDRELVLTEP